jgi:Tfp pilus assembly protein PilV
MKKINFKKGIMLAEILIATFIFSIILGVLITINNLYVASVSSSLKSIKALYLAEEGMEAVRIIRDTNFENFKNLTNDQGYYLYFSDSASSTWEATTSISYKNISGVDRWFVLSPVRRSYGKITDNTSGELDENTKKLTVYVSWSDRDKVNEKTLFTYLTKNILE